MALSKVEEELERIHSRNEDLLNKIKQVDQAQDKRIGELERRMRELEMRAPARLSKEEAAKAVITREEFYAKPKPKKRG